MALIGGLAAAFLGGGAAVFAATQGRAPDVPAAERARIERVVREYILANPEIIPEAIERLQAKQASAAIGPQRAALETPYAGAWAGAANGDVTLVEFYDYSCGYCRQAVPTVDRLLAEDKRLKVVYRELPVLGPDSEAAALASLAAARAGRFKPFHNALYAAGRPTPSTLATVRARTQVPAAAPADARAELEKNIRLAESVGITGTPGYVIGNRVIPGAVDYETLKAAVAEARRAS